MWRDVLRQSSPSCQKFPNPFTMYLNEEYTVSTVWENGVPKRRIDLDFWQGIILREDDYLDDRKRELERALEHHDDREVVEILGKFKFPHKLLDIIPTFCHFNSYDECGPCSWERTWTIEYLDVDQTKRCQLEEFQGKFDSSTFELSCNGQTLVYSDGQIFAT